MQIENKVKQTIQEHKLCNKKEKILVALSGGKDSSVVCYLLKNFGFHIEGFHIHLGMGDYSAKCLNAVKHICKALNIKLHIYDIKKEMGNSMCYLRSVVQSNDTGKGLKNCAICGVIKKMIMNREARKLCTNKIATGHNLDDEVQTFLINIFKGSPELSINIGPASPKTPHKHNAFVPRIKPLFFIPENEIKNFSKQKKLPVIYEKCPCAIDSYRIQVRKFTNTLSNKNKLNIIKNFQKIQKKVQNSKTELQYCKICGEPARNSVCKMCEMLKVKE